MKIKNLQVNHLTNPIGIDGKKLRISWNLEGGKKQIRFEIMVRDKCGNVIETTTEESDKMVYFLKQEIPSKSKVMISVKVWDEENITSEVKTLTVVTGIQKDEWRAQWIDPELYDEKQEYRRASYLKKFFCLQRNKLKQ